MERAVFEVRQVAFDHAAAACGDLSQFSAEEYLAWVVHEASTLPDVMRAEKLPRQTTEADSNESAVHDQDGERLQLTPDISWERDFIQRFSSLTEVMLGHHLLIYI